MKRTIKLNKTELKNLIAESVRRTLKEWNNDYEGNDLDYDSIQMQAMSVIPRMEQNGQDISWRSVAEQMGFRLETLNGDDMELLKDAIEDVMSENEVDPHWKEDMEFENDFQNLPYANESRKKANQLTNKILAEVTRRLKANKKLNEEYYPEEDDMMDDYYYGAMMTFSIEGMFDDLSEETIQNLTNTNEEYCENSNSYCSVMVTKVNVQPDDFGGYDITVEAAVSAPEMPIDAIEEDAENQIWYWFEDKTNTSATRVVITDEREVFDNRTEKYKPTSSLNESANTRYKGFKCINTSNDPSFPTYAIISPQGEEIATTLFPSEMKEIVDEYLNGN